MKEYKDHEGKKLEKGFYLPLMVPNDFELFYFTGEYNDKGPLFLHEEKNKDVSGQFEEYILKRLVRVPNESVIKTMEKLKNKASWIENKLKK
jgi:hypothetical protein